MAASIVIKGANKGATTDSYGNFEMANVEENAIIVISAVGLQSQEIKAANISQTIVLKISDSKLDEIVFKGYYSESKRLSTGSVSKVTAADIEKQPVSNPLQAITGRMPGVYVTEGSGIPGGIMTIKIRGQNSLRNTISDNGNLPLYVYQRRAVYLEVRLTLLYGF